MSEKLNISGDNSQPSTYETWSESVFEKAQVEAAEKEAKKAEKKEKAAENRLNKKIDATNDYYNEGWTNDENIVKANEEAENNFLDRSEEVKSVQDEINDYIDIAIENPQETAAVKEEDIIASTPTSVESPAAKETVASEPVKREIPDWENASDYQLEQDDLSMARIREAYPRMDGESEADYERRAKGLQQLFQRLDDEKEAKKEILGEDGNRTEHYISSKQGKDELDVEAKLDETINKIDRKVQEKALTKEHAEKLKERALEAANSKIENIRNDYQNKLDDERFAYRAVATPEDEEKHAEWLAKQDQLANEKASSKEDKSTPATQGIEVYEYFNIPEDTAPENNIENRPPVDPYNNHFMDNAFFTGNGNAQRPASVQSATTTGEANSKNPETVHKEPEITKEALINYLEKNDIDYQEVNRESNNANVESQERQRWYTPIMNWFVRTPFFTFMRGKNSRETAYGPVNDVENNANNAPNSSPNITSVQEATGEGRANVEAPDNKPNESSQNDGGATANSPDAKKSHGREIKYEYAENVSPDAAINEIIAKKEIDKDRLISTMVQAKIQTTKNQDPKLDNAINTGLEFLNDEEKTRYFIELGRSL